MTDPRGALRRIFLGALGIVMFLFVREAARAEPGTDLPAFVLENEVLYADALAHGPETQASPDAPAAWLSVLLATESGALRAVSRQVARLGGRIRFEDVPAGYVRVDVRIEDWPRLRTMRGLRAVRINGPRALRVWTEMPLFPARLPAAEKEVAHAEVAATRSAVQVLPTLPAESAAQEPYRALRSVGLDALKEEPGSDGRGVTIALVESGATGVFLTHPAFRSALDMHGDVVPKIADVVTADPGWRHVRGTRVHASERVVWVDGNPYQLPHVGDFWFALLRGPFAAVAAVWDPLGRDAWIDSNGNRDFADEPLLKDARQQVSAGMFQSPGFRHPFVVMFDADGYGLTVHPIVDGHVSMMASIAAGADVPDNYAVGFAPAARLVLVKSEGASHSSASHYLEAMILAARNPSVDIIVAATETIEESSSSRDTVTGVVLDRIATVYDKLVVHSAGNGFGIAGGQPPAALALSVGAYASGERAWAFSSVPRDRDHWILPYSDRGTRVGSLLRPDVVAPASHIAAARCLDSDPTRRQLNGYRLPDCYLVGGGTSGAAAAVGGIAASLLGAARQRGLSVSATTLRSAIVLSARFLPGIAAIDQGSGLIQADAAWALLQTFAQRCSSKQPLHGGACPSPVTFGSVVTGDATANDMKLEFGENVVRRSDVEPYIARLLGDDRIFRSLAPLQWRAGSAILPIAMNARESGLHSAIVRLHDPATGMLIQQPIVVLLPDELPTALHHSKTYMDQLRPLERREYFVRVPASMSRLSIRSETSGPGRMQLYEPSGRLYSRFEPVPRPYIFFEGDRSQREIVVPEPAQGVWSIVVSNNPDRHHEPSPLGIRLTVAASDTHISPVAMPSGVIEASVARSGLADDPVTAELASAAVKGVRLQPHQPIVIPIQVPSDASSLLFDVAPASARTGRLLLIVYDCTAGYCRRADLADRSHGRVAIRLHSPAPGLWKVAVVSIEPAYQDAFIRLSTYIARPSLGSVRRLRDPSSHRKVDTEIARFEPLPAGACKKGRAILFGAEQHVPHGGSMTIETGAALRLDDGSSLTEMDDFGIGCTPGK